MRKIPISGGPNTGKTTLFNALQTAVPEAFFVPEPAERVIFRELSQYEQNPHYTMRVPWIDYAEFGPIVADESVILEAAIPPNADLVFQDRSLVDMIGYCRLNNLGSLIPETQRRIAAAGYAFALFCEPVGSYTTTEVRREDPELALRTHDFLREAYDESGLDVITVSAAPVEDRVAMVREALEQYGYIQE